MGHKPSLTVKLSLVFVVLFPFEVTPTISPYHVSRNVMNWFEAVEYCTQQGKRLAIDDSDEKHVAIVQEAHKAKPPTSQNFELWLGASDLAQVGNYVWHSTGEPVRYTHWKYGEPTGGNEHCLVLFFWPAHRFNYTWNDFECGARAYALCERNEKSVCFTVI